MATNARTTVDRAYMADGVGLRSCPSYAVPYHGLGKVDERGRAREQESEIESVKVTKVEQIEAAKR